MFSFVISLNDNTKNVRAVKIASKSGCPEDSHFSKYSCPHRIFGCPHTKKECWLPGNIIKCLVYKLFCRAYECCSACDVFLLLVMIKYMPISKISKVGKTWLSACTPLYSFSVVRMADTGHADTRFLQP